MEVEGTLSIFVSYNDCGKLIELYEYDTVGMLKTEIHKHFKIPTYRQAINGWKSNPECENTVLKVCTELNELNILEVKDAETLYSDVNTNCSSNDEDVELEATFSFLTKISTKYELDCSLKFHTSRLTDAISEACLAPLEKRKILLLYLHKDGDKFSSTFMENLKKPNVVEILKRNFFVLGWDIEETTYRDALPKAFSKCSDLSNLAEVINYGVSTALFIVPIKESVTVLSCLKGNVPEKDLLSTLDNAEKFLIIENQQEKDLEELEKQTGNENDMGFIKYQQLMADMLGDRDYDGFDFDQHDFLRKKIAFALLGQPTTEEGDGYDEKDMKQVDRLLKIILKNNNEITRYKDRVEISFIYNCTVPLPSEKIKRAKKYEDYNPNTDLMPVPIFVLRKCQGSENPCRIFIDHMGRTYQTWEGYKTKNKLHQCEMVLPLNGRYEIDENGNVLLERHLSPACGIDIKILQGADYASITGSLLAGGIFLAAAIPGITVAPAAIVVGGITGVGVGIYSIARSAYILYDRSKHKETLSFVDSEARGAYINILAGALGFVGVGANIAVTQFAARGANIGMGARTLVDTIAVVNISASGVAVINSGYDVLDRWINDKQSPSLLTVVQLTSSILFFGNAVYNFKMCSTIVEETQMKVLESYQDSLRSNRHRKTFSKMLKETMRRNDSNQAKGRADVISAIRNIQNKDEVFAVLTRSQKVLNDKGIKIYAVDGEIVLDGVKINYNEFTAMNKNDATSFLSNLSKSESTPVDTTSTRLIVADALPGFSLSDIESLTNVTVKLLGFCDGDIKTKIIKALAQLVASLTTQILGVLDEIFPHHSTCVYLLRMVTEFFARKAEKLEEQYTNWVKTGDESYYHPLFRYVQVQQITRVTKFFEQAVDMYYKATQLTEVALEELLTYFHVWLTKQISDYQQDRERAQSRRAYSASAPTTPVNCPTCCGHYYEPEKIPKRIVIFNKVISFDPKSKE